MGIHRESGLFGKQKPGDTNAHHHQKMTPIVIARVSSHKSIWLAHEPGVDPSKEYHEEGPEDGGVTEVN